jgi:hypothetical protein
MTAYDDDDDDDDEIVEEAKLEITIKRESKKKSGFEVQKNKDDGYYYVSKVPKGHTKVRVGDRVLNINGISFQGFRNTKHANSIIESLRLEV